MDRGPTLPGVSGDDEDAIVLHVDLDCFYAACERLREPALEGEPVVVGMGYEAGESSGAVATASYEARDQGVESAQAITTALERLPRAETPPGERSADAEEPVGYYRPVDMEYYESIGTDVKSILQECADVVREVSIDEAYLDVTQRTGWEVAEGFARHVKQRIRREVGLTASIGVAPTMHAAKVASDHDKPDGLVVVEPGEVRSFLAPLPVEDLHGIGPVTARELREDGVETVGDLAGLEPGELAETYGQRGKELVARARGIDQRSVEPRGRPKSLSRESAFGDPEDDHETVVERIRTLAEAVSDRATRKEALYRTIGIKVVTPPFESNTRERSLPGPVDDPELVETVSLDLLSEFEEAAVRKVGVRVSNLSFTAGDQATLDGWDGSDGGEHPSPRATDTDRHEDGQRTLDMVDTDSGAVGADDTAGDESDLRDRSIGQTTLAEFE
jgi:DNA polymerase IV (DinB-like DNA polymerase)